MKSKKQTRPHKQIAIQLAILISIICIFLSIHHLTIFNEANRVWVFNTIGIFNTFKMVLAIGIFNTFDIFVKLKYWYWIHSFYSDQYPILFISEFSMFFVYFWGSLKENWFLLSIMEIWQMKTLKNSYYYNWISFWLIQSNKDM